MNSRTSGKVVAVAAVLASSAVCLWKFGIYASQILKAKALLAKYKVNLSLPHSTAMALQAEFRHQMEEGLAQRINTRLLMLPSYITKMPTGDESGQYLAVDLGGTSFRVLHIIFGDKPSEVLQKSCREMEIPQDVFTGTTLGVFDFIAKTIVQFAQDEGLVGSRGSDGTELPPIGFCFSFPMHQKSIRSGNLIRWTKGFRLVDGIGCDPVEELEAALERQQYPSNVVALMNDTIGVFAAARYQHPKTGIGLILGTGTNACYVESTENVEAMGHPEDYGFAPKTVINTEWGDFDSDLIPRCQEDRDLDTASVRPGQMVFEKLVSGMYLGECARRILLTLVKETGILAPSQWARLQVPNSLATPFMAAIDHDDTYGQEHTVRTLMLAFGLYKSDCSFALCWLVKQVVGLVADRAARLVALGLCAVLAQMKAPETGEEVTIAVDGSMYKKYTKLRIRIHQYVQYYHRRGHQNSQQQAFGKLGSDGRPLRPLAGPLAGSLAGSLTGSASMASLTCKDFKVDFVDCEGGSCVGAAVIAAAVMADGGDGVTA